MKLKKVYDELKAKDTWLRVAEWMSHDPGKRKRGFKFFGMDKKNEIPFIITIVITIITVIVVWLIVDSIIPTKK